MERSIEVLALVLFGVLGLSHILQPEAWVETFILIRGQGAPGSFLDGLPYLILAAIVIAFHNVWSGIPVVLTLIGWAALIKSLLDSACRSGGENDVARVDGSGVGVSGGRRRHRGPRRCPRYGVYAR